MSHDLRAPLRSLNGFSRILLEDYAPQLDAEGVEHLERIHRASIHMGELIDGLLNLSRLTRKELASKTVDLRSIVAARADALRIEEPGRDVEFILHSVPPVHGDPVLLETAVVNLLDNAWKFTRGRDRARIEVGVAESEDGPAFFVRDNGVGFDLAHADKLFGPFQRLHERGAFPGMGIGLATVQRVIRRHGGDVWAEGRPGEGASFYFTLPQVDRERFAVATRSESAS